MVVVMSPFCSSLTSFLEHSQATNIENTIIAMEIVKYKVGVQRNLYHTSIVAVDLRLPVDDPIGVMVAARVM